MLRTRQLVVALGDSLTAGHVAGEGWYPTYAPYTSVLEERLGSSVSFLNAGVDGDLVGGMLSRLERDVLRHRPTMVVVLGGTNDLGWGRPPRRIAADLASLWDRLRWNEVDVVAATLPPALGDPGSIPPRLELNRLISEGTQERGLGLVDLFSALGRDGELLQRWSSDGLHLNEDGYRRMGELIAPVIMERLPRGGI